MVFSRQQAKAAFTHVLDNVLGKDDSSPLKRSLVKKGIEDIFALSTIRPANVETLVYDKSATEPDEPVIDADKNLLMVFLSYISYARRNGNPLSDSSEWTALNENDFDSYRIGPHFIPWQYHPTSTAQAGTASTGMTTTASTSSTTSRYTPAELFKRGIKRDPNVFPVLKEEKFNDAWHRSFANQARAQDVMEVLDPTYVPASTEEKDLFNEKLKFVYAILEQKVLTDRGKGFIREHENDYDAQKVYKKLVDHHLKSTKAMIDSSSILSYITSVRLGNGMWKGTTEGFITHWENQVRLYERQVPTTDHFSDGQKRTMLENAVAPVDELRQIKNNADLEKTKTGRTLTFNEYTSLLLSASVAYDESFKPKISKRLVNVHEAGDTYDDVDTYDQDWYDIDVSVREIQANAHNRMSRPKTPRKEQPQRTRMPFDRWSKLSANDRTLWDQLDETAKAVILGTTVATPSSTGGTVKRRTNLHEISAYDFLQANIHETAQDSAKDDLEEYHEAREAEDQDMEQESTLLVNSTNAAAHKTLTPGDIRRVMSTASKRYQGNKSTLDVKMHATYVVSAHRSENQYSLVDRGSNGGVAGNDVRVVSKSSRKVDIRGIDNHQLNDVEIGTVGAYVETHKGPVIAIFHQYALFGKGTTIHSPGQFEHYKNDVNDKSVHVGGLQRIKTLDGYTIPLDIKNGLARMHMRPYTDQEWENLPHVFMTGEPEWNPSVLDHALTDDVQWYDAVTDLETDPTTNLFDEYGNYRRRVVVQHAEGRHSEIPDDGGLDNLIDMCVFHARMENKCDDLPPLIRRLRDEYDSDDEAGQDDMHAFIDAQQHEDVTSPSSQEQTASDVTVPQDDSPMDETTMTTSSPGHD